MTSRASVALFSPLALLLAAPCFGQKTRVVPASFATKVGYYIGSPFHSGRFQQLLEGQTFCTTLASLNEIAFRRDAVAPGNYPAQSVPMTLRVGVSKRVAANMSDQFASNWNGAPQTVFSGSYNLPPNIYLGWVVHPFNIAIKFTKPFLYRRVDGSLLFEIEVPSSPPSLGYAVAGHVSTDVGRFGSFGTPRQVRQGSTHLVQLQRRDASRS